MTVLVSGIVACAFYFASIATHLRALHEGATTQQRWLRIAMWLAVPALLGHLLSWSTAVFRTGGLDLGLFNAASLFFWVIALVAWAASWRAPLANLLPVLYLLAIVSVLSALFLHTGYAPRTTVGWGVGSHILFSLLSYSILGIAALQALALALLIHRLKHR
ncbi:MAG TPA: hypothetical protein PKZ77_01495, partial [Pseudomonadales bacterium]|nr:hypothetical protein [Pseudomonadales bacterium]